ncbi:MULTISPECIES: class I SAM-dependent methyltransferase [Marinobacter]|uniref:Class I SAM-dependent methyltransferase n=1 Tax=Marinobacter suaedae TaxID=3057675 RepID=A0ABT8VX54_9GAMM|nr:MULTISPECIES: class I SAM-dependent methyltransferase [unclassified Marinobacter]MBZ2168697.1 class I SAM-dependent methyltransferase [Marinobacter sp. F4216]MDO3720575.1 class I SAM-dependent methyltransferase [Marinobacter sp. chi1]
MPDLTPEQLEQVAQEYDRRLTPTLFVPWNFQTLEHAHLKPGFNVLDVACGPGELTLGAARQVAPDGQVIGYDLNPGMLAVARRKSADITWQQGDAEVLPFDDNQFDAVLCQFGLMLLEHPATALREMIRVLKPKHHLVVTVFDGFDQQPVYRTLSEIYTQVVSPEVGHLLAAPFSLGDPDTLDDLFTQAGIHDYSRIRLMETARFPSLTDLVQADIRGWFPFAGVALTDEQTEAVIREAESALSAYQLPDGTVEFSVPAHIITATKALAPDDGERLAI